MRPTPPEQLDTLSLLVLLADLKDENRRLRNTLRKCASSRARWRSEAKAWKWGALHNGGKPLSPASTDLSTAGRAEGS